eukprot:147934-Amphidinium_carterae.1
MHIGMTRKISENKGLTFQDSCEGEQDSQDLQPPPSCRRFWEPWVKAEISPTAWTSRSHPQLLHARVLACSRVQRGLIGMEPCVRACMRACVRAREPDDPRVHLPAHRIGDELPAPRPQLLAPRKVCSCACCLLLLVSSTCGSQLGCHVIGLCFTSREAEANDKAASSQSMPSLQKLRVKGLQLPVVKGQLQQHRP